ncbi:hypothetical protein AURDEDRAFT_178608 [Auricularia subglabra TFB-10046 SS5]|uniref:Uncharacterized protein n=1 Tax=Auricularia subglabra (strain TFB-10046 / SS5) TaxID=717982 RepID=J0CQ49_AURST|nr:hypothetical protein AURDEDRAFT_178608 [Auricularia subglabra TFB-10046 SS5]
MGSIDDVAPDAMPALDVQILAIDFQNDEIYVVSRFVRWRVDMGRTPWVLVVCLVMTADIRTTDPSVHDVTAAQEPVGTARCRTTAQVFK